MRISLMDKEIRPGSGPELPSSQAGGDHYGDHYPEGSVGAHLLGEGVDCRTGVR
jgi:hypothetical protein